MWYHPWHKVHPKFPCEYILPWSNTVCDYLDHPLFKLIRKTNAPSAQHVLLNILQETWKDLFSKLSSIIQFPIYEIKCTKHLEENTQNLKNNSPNQGKHCTKQLKLFPKTKKFHTKPEKILTKSKKNYTKLKRKSYTKLKTFYTKSKTKDNTPN